MEFVNLSHHSVKLMMLLLLVAHLALKDMPYMLITGSAWWPNITAEQQMIKVVLHATMDLPYIRKNVCHYLELRISPCIMLSVAHRSFNP